MRLSSLASLCLYVYEMFVLLFMFVCLVFLWICTKLFWRHSDVAPLMWVMLLSWVWGFCICAVLTPKFLPVWFK
jgi:hypothetical protein